MTALWLLLLLASLPAQALTTIHYRPRENLVYLSARVNGSRPLQFVLDSGAPHSVVDSTAAVGLGLRPVSEDRTGGAGRGTVGRQHLASLELGVGGVTLHVADPWAIDLSHLDIPHIDGLIGLDLFEKFVVRIDPERGSLTLFDLDAMPAGSGTPIPLTLETARLC